ncbi:MAG TPA: 4-hydroxy-tetrahydrodipicolinate synthase [Stenomitos sp.]
MARFGRIVTAMVTPFTDEGQVDYTVAAKLADHLVNQGSDGLVVCGTTGESPTLTWAEEYQLFQVIQQAVAGRAKIIAGTGSNSTHEAIEATRKAASLGLDGALLVVPYYNKPPQEGLYAHFKAISTAVPDLPIMLYNVPGRTGQNLAPHTVARLAELDNVVAIKEASGSLDQASQIRCLTPPDFELYCGDDSLTLPMLAIGGVGVVSVASHLVGTLLQKMVEAFVSGQSSTAAEIHLELTPLFKVLFATTNPIPVKAALQMQGWAVGQTRLPLSELPSPLAQDLRQVLADLSLL